jgi:hypothetical protein
VQSITLQNGVFTAINGDVTITTEKIVRGLPCFKINQNLFKVFPFIRGEIQKYILSNHRQQPITIGDTYRKYGRCWIPTKITATDDGYCPFNIGREEWGFAISGQLHVAAFIAFGYDDIEDQTHHLCHVKCCCNPDHITDIDQSTHQKIHVAERETIDESQLYSRGDSKKKITNPMSLLIRHLVDTPYSFNHDLLAFVFNCSTSSIGNVVSRRTHEFDNPDHEKIFKRLSAPQRKKVKPNAIHDKLILNGKKAGLKMTEISKILNRRLPALYSRKKELKKIFNTKQIINSIPAKHREVLDSIREELLESYHTFKYGDQLKLARKYGVDAKVVRSMISRLKYKKQL